MPDTFSILLLKQRTTLIWIKFSVKKDRINANVYKVEYCFQILVYSRNYRFVHFQKYR